MVFFYRGRGLIITHANHKIIEKRWWQTFAVSAIIAWQAALIIQKFPYSGTVFNPLFGGHQTTAKVFPLMDQGEGIRIASLFIENLEKDNNYTVACTTPPMCQQNIKGETVGMSGFKKADYLIFDRNKIVRELAGGEWDNYKNKKPLKIISFDNIPYIFIYKGVN